MKSVLACHVDRLTWSWPGVEAAYEKATTLLKAGCTFSEFGTRRRRSLRTQRLVMEAILKAAKDNPGSGTVNGTSNVRVQSRLVP